MSSKEVSTTFADSIRHLRKREQIDARAKKIYDLLCENPKGLNSFKLQKLTGLKATEIRFTLHFLVKEGVAKAEGEKRARMYSVVME
jgi:hypothetical protein